MLRAFPKLFSTAAAPVKGAVTRASAHTEAVPDVMVTFGVRMNQITFVSHPGVMAVSKLLEMHSMTSSRAILTQENVAAIREFDEELANKAQIALDHQLPINFMDLEHIDKPNMLAMLLEEKEVLEVARQEVLDAPKNVYAIPKIVESYRGVEIPRALRPELETDRRILEATPEGQEHLQMQQLANAHLNSKTVKNPALSRNDKMENAQLSSS